MNKTGKQVNPMRPKAKLGLLDLGHSRSAVLESLRSPESKRGYRHALDEFIEWYCSEPRLSFNKTVVTRYRITSKADTSRQERSTDGSLLFGASPTKRRARACSAQSWRPGIRRVKGVKKLGVRLGNWLTAEEGRRLWQAPDAETLKGSETAQSLLSCSDAGSEGVSCLIWITGIYSGGRNIGP